MVAVNPVGYGDALSARTSRHAGLLSRSHAISSKLGTIDIVGRHTDILSQHGKTPP
jgi:hypothetical protein